MSNDVSDRTDLDAGLAALSRFDWPAACTHLAAAAEHDRSPAVLEALGMAYFWADHPDTIEVREEAYRGYRDNGDMRSAARLAASLAFDHATFNGETAVAQGWLELAGRALAGLDLVPEHGLVAMWEADFAVESADTDLAEQKAARVVEIGETLGNTDLELIGQAQQGYVKVVRGEVDDGMRMLDAAAAAAVTGEFSDQAFAGWSCCYLISACTQVRDFVRAAQWCDKLDAHCERVGFHSLQQRCRIEHAEVLVEQGDWTRAESEMLEAADILTARRPPVAIDAIVRLGELRRRQGRAAEAIELFRTAPSHPLAVLGSGALAMDRGDAAGAADIAERYLRHLSPKDRIGRFTGLELLATARAAAGDVEGARVVLEELKAAVESMSHGPLAASVHHVEGQIHLAAGDLTSARRYAEDAMQLYERVGVPFGAASARSLLARILLGLDDAAGAELEAAAAASVFDELGAVAEAERARRLVAKQAESSPITTREAEVLRLVADGLNNAEIAQRLVLSEHTVHRHVANMLSKLGVSTRAAAVARASSLGLL